MQSLFICISAQTRCERPTPPPQTRPRPLPPHHVVDVEHPGRLRQQQWQETDGGRRHGQGHPQEEVQPFGGGCGSGVRLVGGVE